MHLIVDLLKNDCGISFLYEDTAKKELKRGKLIKIPTKKYSKGK